MDGKPLGDDDGFNDAEGTIEGEDDGSPLTDGISLGLLLG